MQMKMEKKMRKFDRNKVRKLLEDENEYIVDLLTTFDVPESVEDKNFDDLYLLSTKNLKRSTPTVSDFKKRAQNVEELEERLEIIKNKMQSRKAKVSNRTIKKRELKKLKKGNQLKKKLVSAQKSIQNEKIKEEKFDPEDHKDIVKPVKPIFNEEGKMVFSKFDFASHPGAKVKKSKRDKVMRNPSEILKTMKEQKNKISELQEKGEEEKAKKIKEELAWKKVFDKTEGKKVKDDPNLLHKAIKRRKDQKKKSKQKWTERKEKVEQGIAAKQKKRQENINKKIKEKKIKKLKRASKKGRIIPGF